MRSSEARLKPPTRMTNNSTAAPLKTRPADSGSPQCPITYTAYPGEQPVFSGGREVSGWRRETGDRFSVTVPAAANHQWVFRQLWVNGERRTLARLAQCTKTENFWNTALALGANRPKKGEDF